MKNDLVPTSTSAIETVNFIEEIDLQKYWQVLQRRWGLVLAGLLAGLTLAGLYVLFQSKNYRAQGMLLVKPDESSQLVGINPKSSEIKAATSRSDPLSTEAEILKSLPVLETSVKTLDLRDHKGQPISAIKVAKKLTVKPVTGTDILQVMYRSDDADRSVRLVNQVMQDYITNNVKVNRSQTIAAREFILAELPKTENAVRKAENALQRFRETNGVVALGRETEESVRNIGLLTQNINSSAAQLSQAEARVAQLRSQIGMDVDQALQMNALNQSEAVQKALAEVRLAEGELAKQRTLYQEDAPEIKQLVEQVAAAQALLQEQTQQITGQPVSLGQLQMSRTQQDLVGDLARAETERTSLKQGLTSLVQSRSSMGAKSQSIPALESTQRELQRQVDAAQTTYNMLLNKLKEVQVAENQTVGNARIVSSAIIPEDRALLKNGVIILGGGVTGLLLGLSLAFLVDYADRSVKTIPEITALMPYSLLGVIPQMAPPHREASLEGRPQLMLSDTLQLAGQEAYQMLQANLRFLPVDQVPRSIMVTSAGAQEGKSTVAANLALALSQGQRRVLVVDADMRYGCQHHVWGASNAVGLSNLLVGQVQLDQAIVAVRDNLDLLPIGTVPPNPLVLLDSTAMAALVKQVMGQYDFVVFDSPILNGTADCTVLNRLVDGSLIVMRLGKVEIEQLKTMRQWLRQSGHRVLGMVVNGVEGRRDREGGSKSLRGKPIPVAGRR
ncbi:MAG: polysaccharide biosynthesis tyrosine autokinase [Alkalinema sp. RU_4_3]|nr:polysaccharide biosynthesis tyrosine autokinase [Alkalinema sp. RU_4_3]